jgi:FdhD protein
LKSVVKKEIEQYSKSSRTTVLDHLVIEEPLDIYINNDLVPAFITMRTPGDDELLALGLLFSTEVITNYDNVAEIVQTSTHNIKIFIPNHKESINQTIVTNSSCGLCNGRSWEEIASHSFYPVFDKSVSILTQVILSAADKLVSDGDDFSMTGGNHKVALIDFEGKLKVSYEDVGRHNAFDKIIGYCLKNHFLPLSKFIAVLSGRCSYEMCLKAWQSGIPVIISKGAPTSKAVELADAVGITLIGFASSQRFNIYSHAYRIHNDFV